jgi:hypothetical protein
MARQFNGTTQAMSSSSTLDLTSVGTGPITIAFWLWWDAFANDDDLAMEFSADFNANAGAFLIDPNSSGVVSFELSHHGTASNYRSASFARPSAAAWHHYMLVLSTTSNANILAYVDGSAVTMTLQSNTGGTSWGNYTLYVMSRSGALFGAGRICGIGIWGSALTAGNATTLAGGAHPVTVGTPLYAWDVCGDDSPEPPAAGGLNLTLVATPPFVANPAAFSCAPPGPISVSGPFAPTHRMS